MSTIFSANAGNNKLYIKDSLLSYIYDNKQYKNESLLLTDVQLLDISFYQKTAVFNTMLVNGIKGVILRAGQNIWEDNCIQNYMRDAKIANMPIGTYWYYDSRISPQIQAQKWKDILGDYETPLYCWADYEEYLSGSYSGWKNLYDFMESCKTKMPNRKFGIYTGYYYWINNSPNPVLQPAQLAYFGQYPLWLGWYAIDPSFVKIPKPWSKMTFWQYTDKGDGTKFGVGSLNVDRNLFCGTLEEYKTLFNLDQIGGTMPDVTYTANIKSTVSPSAIVRLTANGIDSGQRLLPNTKVEITGQPTPAGLYNWYNVITPVVGWVADILLENIKLVTPVPTTEPTVDVVAHDLYTVGDIYAARGIKLIKEA